MGNENAFCLDPSCFTSIKKLAGLHQILSELKKEADGKFQVYVPTQLYDILVLQPNEKFPLLKKFLHGWIGFAESHYWIQNTYEYSEEYVIHVRSLFEQYNLIPAKEAVGNVEKLGKHSIFRTDVIKKLGEKGKMIFEMMAISSELVKARIISFGQRSILLMSKLGVPVAMAPSEFKKKIKKRAGIRWFLLISAFLTTTQGVSEFLSNYQIENLPLTWDEIGSLGLILMADGSI